MSDEAAVTVFPLAPPERIELDGGLALVRVAPAWAPAAAVAINESLDHLRPWMAWAQEPATESGIAEVFAEGDRGWEGRTDFPYCIVDEASGRVIGGCGLHGRLGPTGLEIGYWVHVDRIGTGVATAAARALTTAAFAIPAIERVRIQCALDNRRSARVPEKLGYRLVASGELGEGPCADRPTQQWLVERADWAGAP
jgi:RimJ/RimL family protein N-acetyltransferase